MQIEIFENTVCNGKNVSVGEIIDTDKAQAMILIKRGYAAEVEAAEPVIEQKKPKAKSKVSEV